MEKVIFLDIDGVLNYQPRNPQNRQLAAGKERQKAGICGDAWIDEEKAELLGELASRTSASIVLHSGWRFWFDGNLKPMGEEAKMLAELLKRNRLFLRDVTPDFSTEEIRRTRKFSLVKAKEIKAWLRQHPEVEAWIVLDDLDLHDEEIRKHQVRTNPKVGLTVEDARRAQQMLNGMAFVKEE